MARPTIQSSNANGNYYLQWTKTGNVWSYTITHLPKYDASGNQIVYRVKEIVPTGYRAENEYSSGTVGQDGNITGADFVNTEKTQIVVNKVWVLNDTQTTNPADIGLTEISFHLYRNNGTQEIDSNMTIHDPTAGETYPLWKLTSANSWSVTILNLDKYYLDPSDHQVKTYKYYVSEADPGYGWHTLSYGSNDALVIDPSTGVVTGTQAASSNSGISVVVHGGTVTITNSKYSVSLPATGGIGTTVYTVGGLALILAALGLLVARRKRED